MTEQTDQTDLTGHTCCEEFSRRAGLSRRAFMARSAAATGGIVATRMFGEAMMQTSSAATSGSNVLVVLSMRGGIDGMGVVVPYTEPGYRAARPNTYVDTSQLLAKDSRFGLHPALAPLMPYWDTKQFAALHAIGLPVPNRSHFEAIEAIEDSDPGSSARVGWVNRMVGLDASASSMQAVQLGDDIVPTALTGPQPTLAASSLSDLQIAGSDDATWAPRRYNALSTVWNGSVGPLGVGAREAIAISRGPGATVNNAPASAAAYPKDWPATDLSDALKSAAKLIRADVGTQVIAIDYGSWDLHSNYGTTAWGSMQSLIGGFAGSLRAFLDDLGSLLGRVTVVTISEFGRRLVQNGNGGFDHGWGNMMLLAGAGVKGGQYHARWPGLPAVPQGDDDLQVTVDYRQVLAEIVGKQFPNRSVSSLFPGLGQLDPLGVMA